jgi:Ni,Fe-hydrogenase I cytochrome b subunit
MADHHNADHVHGSMDIRSQEKTFAGFIRMSVWVVCIAIGILIFMGLVNS